MKRNFLFIALVGITFLAQWLIPVSMIIGRERVLADGTEVKMNARSIDPYDPFRGRYVVINAAPEIPESVAFPAGVKRGDTVYTLLEQVDSFARVSGIVMEKPSQGLFLEAEVLWPDGRTLDFGLNRYYMNEAVAPAAEYIVRDRIIRDNATVHATVKLRNGESVITGLFVDGKPVEELAGAASLSR